jgi:hypothetical protein
VTPLMPFSIAAMVSEVSERVSLEAPEESWPIALSLGATVIAASCGGTGFLAWWTGFLGVVAGENPSFQW